MKTAGTLPKHALLTRSFPITWLATAYRTWSHDQTHATHARLAYYYFFLRGGGGGGLQCNMNVD